MASGVSTCNQVQVHITGPFCTWVPLPAQDLQASLFWHARTRLHAHWKELTTSSDLATALAALLPPLQIPSNTLTGVAAPLGPSQAQLELKQDSVSTAGNVLPAQAVPRSHRCRSRQSWGAVTPVRVQLPARMLESALQLPHSTQVHVCSPILVGCQGPTLLSSAVSVALKLPGGMQAAREGLQTDAFESLGKAQNSFRT